MVSLYPLKEFKYPIIAECINPDIFRGKTLEEIKALKIWEGNEQKKLGELFKVEENKTENTIIAIHGDVSKVRRIGAGMKTGEITIHGNVGMHLGEEMRGGRIVMRGNAESWLGSMMKDGLIEVYGDAGDYVGAPYRGCSEGMHGGRITIHGNVGNEAGAYMHDGIIKIYGCAGQFVGLRMHDGTIYVQKDCEARVGACMIDGKVIVGGFLESVLPTFTMESIKERVKIEENEAAQGPFYLFLGDLTENGNGKLYVFKERNPHLSHYERLL
jgi:formylmethanofuran dehydrogenase subunit C